MDDIDVVGLHGIAISYAAAQDLVAALEDFRQLATKQGARLPHRLLELQRDLAQHSGTYADTHVDVGTQVDTASLSTLDSSVVDVKQAAVALHDSRLEAPMNAASDRRDRDNLIGVTEHRNTARFEVRADANELTLTGYASTFKPYEMYGGPAAYGWIEQLDRNAFDKTLKEKPDLHLLINHEGMLLARTKSGTLKLLVDDHGLKVEAKLDRSDPDVQRLEAKMKRGDMDEMSFAFRVKAHEWNAADGFEEDNQSYRRITEVSLHKGDVSVVNFGANPTTSADLRKKKDTKMTTMSLSEAQAKIAEDRGKPMSLAQAQRIAAVDHAHRVFVRQTPLLSVGEPRTYEKGNGRSYLADVVRSVKRLDGAREADERLRRHAQDVQADSEYRAMDRADGSGGEFVPPAHLVSQYVELARSGRAYANLAQQQVLPPKTDSLKIPRVH